MAAFKVTATTNGVHSFRVFASDGSACNEINAYLEHLTICGKSVYTLKSYARGLAHFMDWLQQNSIELTAVNTQQISNYIGAFARSTKQGACLPDPKKEGTINARTRKPYPSTQRKNTTINHRVSVLTHFFDFCIDHDTLCEQGPWKHRVNPIAPFKNHAGVHGMIGRDPPPRRGVSDFRRRTTQQLPKALTPALAEEVVSQANSWRDKAILILLLRTGQRIGDWHKSAGRHGILGMTTADVDEKTCTITVRLKVSRDQHRVPVTDDFWPIYHRYLECERPHPIDCPALWMVARKNDVHPLSYATFESALRYIGRKMDINVNAHMFRHTLVQGILETTGNLKVAQEILGHAHMSTTADQYGRIDESVLVKALAQVKLAFEKDLPLPLHNAISDSAKRYVFAYDPSTVSELDQASTPFDGLEVFK